MNRKNNWKIRNDFGLMFWNLCSGEKWDFIMGIVIVFSIFNFCLCFCYYFCVIFFWGMSNDMFLCILIIWVKICFFYFFKVYNRIWIIWWEVEVGNRGVIYKELNFMLKW